MIQKKNLLLIGGSGRNVGKTLFTCRLIGRHAGERAVTGIKITVIDTTVAERSGRSGGDSYRVFDGPFQILEEAVSSPDTDTGRMLEAGARRVLWLKAKRDHLRAGIEALLRVIPDKACCIAEGTSARTVIEPGAFLILRGEGDAAMKDSCAAVLPFADRVARFRDRAWDVRPEDCLYVEDEWMLRPAAGALILAGGGSRRMGRDKALLPLGGKPMIAVVADQLKALFEEIAVSADRSDSLDFLKLPVFPDLEPGQGPLMAIASSLPHMTHDLNFVTACDIPRLNLPFVNRMVKSAPGCDLVLPYYDGDMYVGDTFSGTCPPGTCPRFYEPLHAVYRKSVLPEARRILAAGGRSILDLFGRIKANRIEIPDRGWIRNINTEEEYEELAAEMGK